MKLLLISNSTNYGEPYLDYPKEEIKRFLGHKSVNAVFIPFAAVTFSFDEYVRKVEKKFSEVGHHVRGIHTFSNPIEALKNAEAIVVGGGNTWQLVRMMHDWNLMPVIRERVLAGVPYIGWSAGSNVACPTLRTTNDMPILDPKGFDCLNLIPFQINPHYVDKQIEGHGGETREQRILEFICANPDIYVAGLREGCIFWVENQKLKLIGNKTVRIFKHNQEPLELNASDDLTFLLK